MEWNQSYIVKDAMSILRAVRDGKHEYVNSFQPELLGMLTKVMLDCPERPEDFKFEVKAPQHEYKNVCLTSGGADSTIAWYYVDKPHGLYIDLGQPYAAKERKALDSLGIIYTYVNMRGCHLADKPWKHIIPGRNFLFLCIAAEMLKDNGSIWFAMVEGEGADSDKGDKSLMFVSLFEDWYKACTGRTIYVQTMVDRTKAGWLDWTTDHDGLTDIIRRKTVTCFSSQEGQCGSCQACLRKYLSFISIGMDIYKDFQHHPMVGAVEYVKKYENLLAYTLGKEDFSHYSRRRCHEDLNAIANARKLLGVVSA